MTPLDAALEYVRHGLEPHTDLARGKKPILNDWPNRVIDAAAAAELFQEPDLNIGIVLGASSKGLTDVDLDVGEALMAGPYPAAGDTGDLRAAAVSRIRTGSITRT